MITKEMGIMDVVAEHPGLMEVFFEYGMGCIGCMIAQYETIEEGALGHGVDPDQLVDDLNAALEDLQQTTEKPESI